MAASQAAKQRKKTAKTHLGRDQDKDPRVAIDETGNIIYASKEFCRLVGTEFGKIKGRRAENFLELADNEQFYSSGDNGKSLFAELGSGFWPVILGADKRQYMFHFEWIKIPAGRSYLIGSTNHKTKKNSETFLRIIAEAEAGLSSESFGNIEEKSKKSELYHFVNLSHDVMAIISPEGKFLRVNDTLCALFGYSEKELQGKTISDMVIADDRPAFLNSLRSLNLCEEEDIDPIVDFEARMIDCNASPLCFDWRLKRIGGHIYCVGKDLTAIKEHETELRRREQQLSEAESIGRMGHWKWRTGESRISFSKEIYRIFGIDREEFEPTIENLNSLIHRRDVGRLIQAFQRAILEKNDYDMEFRAMRPDGEVRYVRCRGRCEKDEEDEVVGLFGIMQDITERTLYEINLKEAKDSAERAYAAKSQFLANMSHELRTPLNAIIGFSEMMQRQLLGPIGTDKYLEYIDGIRKSGEHLLDLISDILNMSKIEAGKYDLDLEQLNISKVIKLAMHMVESKAQDAGLSLSADIEKEDIAVVADRRAVMQIVLNLLSNSIKFTGAGGTVKIHCTGRRDYISLKVSDNGAGIPANKLKSITRPFEQAASEYTREHEGSGLGLAITKELAEMHGGSIHIDSTVGVGTTVTVRLPYDATAHYREREQV
jgi:two-component system cell cycle sensor histidine kinase PleC